MGLTIVPKTTSQQADFIEEVILAQLASSEEPITIASELTVTGHLYVNGVINSNGGVSLDTDDITESATKKYILTGPQTILGAKTFSSSPLFTGNTGVGSCAFEATGTARFPRFTATAQLTMGWIDPEVVIN